MALRWSSLDWVYSIDDTLTSQKPPSLPIFHVHTARGVDQVLGRFLDRDCECPLKEKFVVPSYDRMQNDCGGQSSKDGKVMSK